VPLDLRGAAECLENEVVMDAYEALSDVYEWLIPDAKLTPEGSVAALGDLVQSLPSEARVLDCACGTGQLAVGLASLGFDVVATDASAGMVRRTQELADEHGVPLHVRNVTWDALAGFFDPSRFDLVLCVGNSLGHARGRSGRLVAFAAMSRLLNPGGRLVLTSRMWELVRAGGTRIDVRDRLVGRNGHDAVVIYSWQIEELWEHEHHLEIAVARVEPDGTVITIAERLSFWPYRYGDLAAELRSVGLETVESTVDPDGQGYRVVARPGDSGRWP
jgi:SAM-dependent methyltransferase